MINLRGQVNYIFNLRTKFGLPPKQLSAESKFIMLNVHKSTTGCIADEVTDIVKLEDSDLQPAPAFISGAKANYARGIGKIGDRMVIILNRNKILTTEEFGAIKKSQAH